MQCPLESCCFLPHQLPSPAFLSSFLCSFLFHSCPCLLPPDSGDSAVQKRALVGIRPAVWNIVAVRIL